MTEYRSCGCIVPDEGERSRLRQWRNQHGITLEELADVTGWSQPMLSRVERGLRVLTAIEKIHFARRLGVRVREIFPVDREEAP